MWQVVRCWEICWAFWRKLSNPRVSLYMDICCLKVGFKPQRDSEQSRSIRYKRPECGNGWCSRELTSLLSIGERVHHVQRKRKFICRTHLWNDPQTHLVNAAWCCLTGIGRGFGHGTCGWGWRDGGWLKFFFWNGCHWLPPGVLYLPVAEGS